MYKMSNFPLHILIFLWIFLLHSSVYTSDLEGVTVIHLIDDSSPNDDGESSVITEIHASSKALGKQLLDAKGRKMYPFHHSPLYNILHSENNVIFSGSWINETMTASDWEAVFIQITGLLVYHNDHVFNQCADSSSDFQCHCPDGYAILKKGTCKKKDNSCNYFIYASPSGKFATPNFPHIYPSHARCTWTISAPQGRKIRLRIPEMITEPKYDVLSVHEMSESREELLEVGSGHISINELVSKGNVLRVTFVSDANTNSKGGEVFYNIIEKSITLVEDKGSIVMEQFSFDSKTCLSVIYKLFGSGSIEIYIINNEKNHVLLEEKNRYEDAGWSFSRFTSTEYFNEPINISVNMTGKGSLYRIIQCDGTDVDVYPNLFGLQLKTIRDFTFLKIPNDERPVASVSSEKLVEWEESELSGISFDCYNGGTYILGRCICPIGSTGTLCEKVCDKNRYGPGCKRECSGFESGCKNMIFCRYSFYPDSCSCMPGLMGPHCDEECNAGWYGVGCKLRCGGCNLGSCNPYSGKCQYSEECIQGYHSPYCQEKLLYVKYAPRESIVARNNVTINASFNELLGKGSPYLFQVQYKEEHGDWIEMQPVEILLNTTTHNITKLKSGTKYFVRIIIICNDGKSYQGRDIPLLEVTTDCLPHDEGHYEINVTDVTSSSFSFKWNKLQESSILTEHTSSASDFKEEFCPETEYKVILYDRWRNFSKIVSPSDTLSVNFSNLLPGHQYKVHMCVQGIRGIQFCSSATTVLTARTGEGEVDDLQVYSLPGGSLNVTWSVPSSQANGIAFKVNYQCMKMLLCEDLCGDSGGTLETSGTFMELHNLVPLAQYRIRLSASLSIEGSYCEKYATTKSAKPTASPQLLPEPLLSISNSSAVVAWSSPNCYGLNGNLQGYFYRLFEINTGTENKTILDGNTREEQVELHNLTPETNYCFEVYLVNSHGWNFDHKLSINFATRGTVPDVVEELVVYKKGRRTLGVRWAAPSRVYGILKSFRLTYRDEVSKKLLTKTLDPTPCSSWPNLYCHTINNLRPDRNYTIFASAKNKEIDEDGQVSVVHGYTRENAPSAPVYLNISDSTPDSLVLHWGVPMLINGELRSFLVNVEHIDSLNDETCCEYFPVHEVPVSEELPSYSLKVTNLSPASTYIISVTAKTITLGANINLTHITPPAPPSDISPPQLVKVGEDNASYYVNIQPVNELENIDYTYLVLVLHDNDQMPESNITNVALKDKLDVAIHHRFYITSEYSKNELLEGQEITVGTGELDLIGETGVLMNPKLVPGFYQVALTVIVKYGESFSVGFATSDTFEIK